MTPRNDEKPSFWESKLGAAIGYVLFAGSALASVALLRGWGPWR